MSILICCRRGPMRYVHSRTIEWRCHRCGETVGVFPSGQRMLSEQPNLEIICEVCYVASGGKNLIVQEAPGAMAEAVELWKKKPN